MPDSSNHQIYDTSNIQVLYFPETIRKRPSMYLGEIEKAATYLVYELIANVIDLFLAKPSVNHIEIAIDGYVITVKDNGGSFPFGKPNPKQPEQSLVERYLTTLSGTPTVDGHIPHVHLPKGGIGLAIMNAASLKIDIECCDGTKTWQQQFGLGKTLTPVTWQLTANAKPYTKVTTQLDPEIFEGHTPDFQAIHQTLFETAHFYPGLKFSFDQETYYEPKGLKALAEYMLSPIKTNLRQFYYHAQHEYLDLHFALMGETKSQSKIKSWVNGTATPEHGSHVQGLLTALKKLNWQPEVILIHVIMHNPRFAGPCRNELVHEPTAQLIENIVLTELK